jgi:hypothetical protein
VPDDDKILPLGQRLTPGRVKLHNGTMIPLVESANESGHIVQLFCALNPDTLSIRIATNGGSDWPAWKVEIFLELLQACEELVLAQSAKHNGGSGLAALDEFLARRKTTEPKAEPPPKQRSAQRPGKPST